MLVKAADAMDKEMREHGNPECDDIPERLEVMQNSWITKKAEEIAVHFFRDFDPADLTIFFEMNRNLTIWTDSPYAYREVTTIEAIVKGEPNDHPFWIGNDLNS